MIIDDFDSGIDSVRLALLCDLLKEIQREMDWTFLVTTHDMTAARKLADYVAVIHEGRIVASGEADEIFADDSPLVSQLIGGELSGRSSCARPDQISSRDSSRSNSRMTRFMTSFERSPSLRIWIRASRCAASTICTVCW